MAYVGLIYWCPVTRCRKEMALRSVHVDARVVDLCANVQITQRYVNNTANPVEAVYVFPLDNRSAVSGFEVEIDGKVTKADVQEKAEARQTYENAVAAGDSAQLLERVKDDVFQMSVGNLKPWSTTVIRITYVADVAVEGDGVLFFLPTFVAPRYTPAGTEAVPNSDGSAAPDGLRLDVVAAMSSDIVSMTSQTEGLAIVTTPQPGNARVQCAKLANDVMSLSKDLIIKITTKEPHKPRCLVEHDTTADTYAAVVTLAPQIDFDDEPCELIFIVDRSGSMSGYNIEKAKKALELFFRSLPEDCYINIVGFGSRFTKLFSKSKKYGEDSLKEATKHIANLKADLGGTEIAAPLRDVFRQPQVKGYARQVFVLTDGQVSNTDETIRIVREEVKAHPTTRVFALGLGNGASHELVEGIAEAGQGTAAFCVGDENLREKVVSQLSRAIQPALTDVTIEWVGAVGGPPSYEAAESAPTTSTSASGGVGGLLSAFAPSSVGSLLGFSSRTQPPINPADAEGFVRAPFHAPPIVTGSRFLSYCLVKKGGKPPTSVRITAKSPVGPLDVSLPVTQADVVQGSLLHTMAARALINDLQREKSWMHVGGSIGPAAIKDEIVRLGTTYSLASKHTSFVAVQKLDGGPVRYEEDIPQFRAADLAAQSRCFASSGAAPKMKKKGGFNFFGAARGRNSAGTSVRGGGRGSTRSAPKKSFCIQTSLLGSKMCPTPSSRRTSPITSTLIGISTSTMP